MKTYLETLWKDPAAARKALVAIAAVAVQVIALLFPTADWLPVLIAVATAIGVYAVPNGGNDGPNKDE